MRALLKICMPICLACLSGAVVSTQVEQGGGAFRVQCPTATLRHPGQTTTDGTGTVVTPHPESAEAPYTGLV
jgi:hypothetical protein